MRGRPTLRLALTFALAIGAGPATAAAGRGGPARLPDWAGLWETEAAARLLRTGKLEKPKLWGKPPYAKEADGSAPLPGDRPGLVDLPPDTKACGPAGFPGAMEVPVPDFQFELLVTRRQTLLVSTNGDVRHIYTDGRPHPKRQDLWTTRQGHSIGWWRGDTLVVDTIARTPGPVGPTPGAADLSEAAHFTERLRRIDTDTLEDDITIDDPGRFSRPWRIVVRYKRAKGLDRMIPVDCEENDRNPVLEGRMVISPP